MHSLLMDLDRIKDVSFTGRVTSIQGLLVEVAGVERHLSIGSRVHLQTRDHRQVECEVVGFRQNRALLMPYGSLEGIGLGSRAVVGEDQPVIYPDASWRGRVIDGLGRPL